jgi:uncharacterized protein (TIGR04255 family)
MGEKLINPPLAEAVCEFRFTEDSSWDWVLPGQLYGRIQSEFPLRAQIDSTRVQGQKLPKSIPADGSSMVQVGTNILAINQFKPYTSWTAFSGLILKIYAEFREISSKARIERIGLRYINHLPVSENIATNLTLSPPLHGELVRPVRTFYQRYELEHDFPKGVLIHQTGTFQDGDRSVIALDLDFGSTDLVEMITIDGVSKWLEQAHDRIYEGFRASLTEVYYLSLKG